MNTLFYPNTLPVHTAKLLEKIRLSNHTFLDNFYLSGGTALSLQLGHRESEDLDFFSKIDFEPESIRIGLEKIGNLSDTEIDVNTLNADLDQVKIQFLGYPYPMLEPLIDYEGIKLSSVIDIGCTKLLTIGSRGSKKDFLDMFVILEKYTLEELVAKLGEKYAKTEYNFPHILKSLVYFVDADNQPMPRMHREIEWEQVKERLREIVKAARLT
jgi:predicted nucleotidyltransferase component of viral defense system